ncbi:DNA internalization-related competence protein ComEC/Rec2 [Methylolobus aquaticus]|nr:DNA internalization-related competence protein ComEC/Rec2 [Methylolobus aquaticus]
MNEILPRESAPTARVMLAFVAGVAAIQWLPSLPTTWVLVPAVAGLVGLVRYRRHVLAAVLAGLIWALALAYLRVAEELPRALEQSELRLEGTVASVPEVREGETRFLFEIDAVRAPEGARVSGQVRLTWYRSAITLKAGERWRLAVKLKRPHGMLNPGGMDYELWLFAHRIGATGYVRENDENQRLAPRPDLFGFQRWRQALSDALEPVLREARFGGILKALVFGDESDITPVQWDVLRKTGTAHLVAISGSHIALIAGWCFALALKLAAVAQVSRWAPMTVAAWAGFAGALAYSGLADFAIPTRRALVMIAVIMAAVVLKRPVRPFRLLLLAGFAVVAVDPLALLAAGFWLSFVAVAAILWVAAHRLRPPRPLWGLWQINWATALALAPLLLLFFRQIPLLSPLANLIAVPLFGIALIPLCLLGAAMLPIHPPLGGSLFGLADELLAYFWKLLDAMAGLPFAQWIQAQPPLWATALALGGALILLAPRGLPARWLGGVLFAPALTWQPTAPAQGQAVLTLLDVGQGLATVVRTHRHTLVFDTGARFSDRFDIGSAVLWPFLTDQGVTRVDTLVISHADLDHMGGAESLARLMPVGLAYGSAPERLPSSRPLTCAEGQDWTWDGVHFEFLWPAGSYRGSENDRSCVLRVTAGPHRALLTGDIEALAEAQLVERYGERLDADVLIAPHHGSDSSSTRPFLQRVSPAYVLVSAGYRNRFGFPASKVLKRYEEVSAQVSNTAELGALRVELGTGSGVQAPVGYRSTYHRYWSWRP